MDAAFDDGNGGQLYLSSLRGRPVVVAFLATWCIPCLAMLPALKSLHDKHPEVTIVAVGMDLEGRKVLDPFREYYQLPFPVLPADELLRTGRTAFGHLQELPSTALLDAEGRPAAAWGSPVTLEAFEEALEELP